MDHVYDYKGLLQTYAFKQNLKLPVYAIKRQGPPHATTFTSIVEFAGKVFRGEEAKTIKKAQRSAAKVALMSVRYGSELPDVLNGPASIAREMTVASPVPENPINVGSLSATATNGMKMNIAASSSSMRQNPTNDCNRSSSCIEENAKKKLKMATGYVSIPSGHRVDCRLERNDVSYKSLLQELAHKENCPLPLYKTNSSGPSHAPTFTSFVGFAGKVFRGEEAKTKKLAEKNAAKVALMSVRYGPELPNVLNAPTSIAKGMTVAYSVPGNPTNVRTLDAPATNGMKMNIAASSSSSMRQNPTNDCNKLSSCMEESAKKKHPSAQVILTGILKDQCVRWDCRRLPVRALEYCSVTCQVVAAYDSQSTLPLSVANMSFSATKFALVAEKILKAEKDSGVPRLSQDVFQIPPWQSSTFSFEFSRMGEVWKLFIGPHQIPVALDFKWVQEHNRKIGEVRHCVLKPFPSKDDRWKLHQFSSLDMMREAVYVILCNNFDESSGSEEDEETHSSSGGEDGE